MQAMVRPHQFLSPSPTPLPTLSQRQGQVAGQLRQFAGHESPFGELVLRSPDGSDRPVLDWQPLQAVPLLKNLHRLTAPNPGMMTGPGTNTYLLGDISSGYAVIDPGPDDPSHVARLHLITGGDVRMIICTHSHPDHSPAARPLQALCTVTKPPIYGLPAASTAKPGHDFVPDQVLDNHQRLCLQGSTEAHTLQAIHTPGHAANHLCLLLVEDGLLFSGDHILNGSTTVIDPPDGNMDDYLNSLDRLEALCQAQSVEFILPAHGHVLGNASGAIRHLRAHRLQREAKIARALAQRPDGSVQDWLALAYDDVPPQLWPVAARSLLAHVQRIQQHPRTD